MNIVIIGQVNIDKNISEHCSYVSAGSPAIFINRALRLFPDCDITTLSSYGPDFIKYLKNINIYPKKPNSRKTLIYENISQTNGHRKQKAHHRSEANPIPLRSFVKRKLLIADIIFIAPILPNFPVKYISDINIFACNKALKVLLPQGYFRNFDNTDRVIFRMFEEADRILPLVNVVIASDQDYPNIIDLSLKWTIKYSDLLIIITLGKKGAVAIKNGKKTFLPTNSVSPRDILDSVGAGDTFSAAFAYMYQKSRNVAKSGQFANSIARQRLFFKPENMK